MTDIETAEASPPATVLFPVQRGDKYFPHFVFPIAYGQKTVYRRYSDFEWLKSKLSQSYPGKLIPTLPAKDPIQSTVSKLGISNSHTNDFITERMYALERFLETLLTHTTLRESVELHLFLTCEENEFAQVKSENSANSPHSQETARAPETEISIVTETAKAISDSFLGLMRTTFNSTQNKPNETEQDKQFAEILSKIASFEYFIKKFKTICDVIAKDQMAMKTSTAEFSLFLADFSQFEIDQNERETSELLTLFSTEFDRLSMHMNQRNFHMKQKVIAPITFYCLTVKSVKELLQRREIFVEKVRKITEKMNEAVAESAGKDRIEDLEGKLSTEKTRLSECSASILEEIGEFNEKKQSFLSNLLKEYVTIQREYTRKTAEVYGTLLGESC